MITIKFILLLSSVFLGYFLGYMLTETRYRLSRYDVFKFQAFECRKCLSTHIAWVTSTLFSTFFNDWIMFIVGLFFASMLFLGLYLDEKKRTVKIDMDIDARDLDIDARDLDNDYSMIDKLYPKKENKIIMHNASTNTNETIVW